MNLETKVIWTHVKNGLNLDLKGPPLSFRNQVYLLKYAKSEKSNDSNLNN